MHIGDILYHGAYGRSADPVRAWVWYSLASQNGDEVAKMRTARLTDELTPEQLEEAKRQLAAWKPGQCTEELIREESGQEGK
jgi:TPR repeat protein